MYKKIITGIKYRGLRIGFPAIPFSHAAVNKFIGKK
jgi:hypothetical protein